MPDGGPPDDDNMSAGGCTPAFSASCAMDGISREAKGGAFLIVPEWTGKACTDGVWEHAPHGHGNTDEVDEQDADHVPACGNAGHFGVFAGNWGGKWKKKCEDDYMNADIHANTCQVMLMQEVEPLFWHKMEMVQQRNGAAAEKRGEVADKKPLFIGFRGDEGPKDSLLIAGRPGVVLGI